MNDGRQVTPELYQQMVPTVLDQIKETVGPDQFAQGNYEQASQLIGQLVTNPTFTEFLTLLAYEYLN